jgi:hypothetical protein
MWCAEIHEHNTGLDAMGVVSEKMSLAPRKTTEAALKHLKEKYTSVVGYLDTIGFDATMRNRNQLRTINHDKYAPEEEKSKHVSAQAPGFFFVNLKFYRYRYR